MNRPRATGQNGRLALSLVLCCVAMAIGLVPLRDLQSQTTSGSRQMGIHGESARVGISSVPEPSSPRDSATGRSSSKYVVTGALAGVALYGAGLSVYFKQSSNEFLGSPVALLLPALGAAALGAIAGWAFYKLGGG